MVELRGGIVDVDAVGVDEADAVVVATRAMAASATA